MANCVSRYQIYSIAKAWTKHDEVTNNLRDKFGCGKEGDKYRKQEICKLGDDFFRRKLGLKRQLSEIKPGRSYLDPTPSNLNHERLNASGSQWDKEHTSMLFELRFSNTCLSIGSSPMENLKPANDWS